MATPFIYDWLTWILWHIVILGTPIAICWAVAGYRHHAQRRVIDAYNKCSNGCGSSDKKG